MAIILAQPTPIAPEVTAGAAAGEVAMKAFPSLAALYEHISDSRQRAAMSGGGGGGSSGGAYNSPSDITSNAGIAQVEGQANREQQADNLSFDAQNDPVARHIQMQEQFKTDQQRSAQQSADARLAALRSGQGQPGGQPVQPGQDQQPDPIIFDQNDQNDLSRQQQVLSTVAQLVGEGRIADDDAEAWAGPAMEKKQELLKKQQAAQQQAEQQTQQKIVKAQAQQDALAVTRVGHLNKFMPTPIDEIPGMPKKDWVGFDQHGLPVDGNKDIRKSYAENFWKREAESAKAEQTGAHQAQKDERAGEESYLKHYGETAKHVDKLEDEFVKLDQQSDPEAAPGSGGKYQRRRKDPKERAEAIGNHMEAMGLPRSLQDYRNQRKGGQMSQVPTEQQPGVGKRGASRGIVPPAQENDAFHALLGDIYSSKPSAAVPKAEPPARDREPAQWDFSGMGQW